MCGIEDQIANHCNEELTECFYCEEYIQEDEEGLEILTRDHGIQYLCDNCADGYIEEGR